MPFAFKEPESPQQFWANNAVKGKKGFQPTNRGGEFKIGDGEPFGAPFSAEQSSALWTYSQYDYSVNSWLRQGRPEFPGGSSNAYPEMAARMASAARPVPKDMTLLRGVERDAFGLDSITTNNMHVDDRLHSLVGTTIRDRGFMSTTTNPKTKYYADQEIHLHLRVPAGTPVIATHQAAPSKYADEREHTLPPNTGYRITRVVMKDDPDPGWDSVGYPTWDVYATVVR